VVSSSARYHLDHQAAAPDALLASTGPAASVETRLAVAVDVLLVAHFLLAAVALTAEAAVWSALEGEEEPAPPAAVA